MSAGGPDVIIIKKKPKVKVAVKGTKATITVSAKKVKAKKFKGSVVVKKIVREDEYGAPAHDPSLFNRWVGRWESTTVSKPTAAAPDHAGDGGEGSRLYLHAAGEHRRGQRTGRPQHGLAH